MRSIVTRFRALRRTILVLALLAPVPVLAAGFACAPPADAGKKGTLDELEEVVITGKEAATDPKDFSAWLRLLVGQYTYEGYVDLCGKGNAKEQRPVTGKAECIASGVTPNVHCTVNVRWPATRGENGAPVRGGVSTLQPASLVFSLENRYLPEIRVSRWGLMFAQVDNKGTAEWASGTLVGSRFSSREPCVDIPGNCQKITQITVKPDRDEIVMFVDVKINDERVLRHAFLLHRDQKAQNGKPAGGSSR